MFDIKKYQKKKGSFKNFNFLHHSKTKSQSIATLGSQPSSKDLCNLLIIAVWIYVCVFRDNLHILENDVLMYFSGNLLHFFHVETGSVTYHRCRQLFSASTNFNEMERSLNYVPPVQILYH